MAKCATNASGAIWWPNFELMQVPPFGTNSGGITWWSNFELIQVEPHTLGTNAGGILEFYLAGEITQVKDSIPWVRCAFGNVLTEDRFQKKRPSCLLIKLQNSIHHP